MDTRRSASIALALLGFVITSHVIAAVGHTPGSANVSDTGEASYSIPIFTPPGTSGMTPRLALVYGHRNGGTLLGAGWGISGLSAITRCSKIWDADGELREPRNDYSDRFCLDGNKLRLTSGTYGNAGATYQTETETFARITSNGILGNGPQDFVLIDRNGIRYEYGNTELSRIQSIGQATVRAWALNRISDQSGNEIKFTYAEDTVNGAYRIDLIEYTGNPTQGVTPVYQIDFVWEAKPAGEIASGYMAGSLIKEVNRLNRIDVTSGVTLVRRYELTYEGSLSSTTKSRLQSVQECAGSPLDCLSATTFVYQNGTAGFGSEVNTAVSMPTTPWVMDVNGDGRDDLVYSSSTTSGSGTWMVLFANSSGGYITPATNTFVPNINYSGAMPIDYNGDGFGDLMVPNYGGGGSWWVMTGSTSGLALPFNSFTPATATGTAARAMDVNGDGLDDLVWVDLVGYAGGDAIRYRARTPGGPNGFSATITTLVTPYPANEMIEAGVFPLGQTMPHRIPDFNGDGRGDLVFRHIKRHLIDGTNPAQYTYMRKLIVVCAGGFTFTVTTPNAAGTPWYGDFNGDGKSDLAYLNASGTIVARYSTGAGLTPTETPVVSGTTYVQQSILDWDHDGKDDILLTNTSGTVFVARSTGQAFAAPATLSFTPGGFGTVADINGDGLHDLAYAVSGTWRFRLHTLTEADLLQTATDGFGNYSTFSYAPLASYSLYTKQTGAVFPLQDYNGALQVVTNVASSNGIGGSFNLQTFRYQGARLHLQGRGFLGFEYRSWIDSRDGTAQRRSFRQDFPYIGAVTNAKRTQEPSGTAITEVQTTYAKHSYGTGFEKRSLPFVSQTTRYDREAGGALNGALVRTVVQSNTVNATTGVAYDTTITTTEPASGANGVQPGASYVQHIYQPIANLTTNANCLGKPQHIEQTSSHNLAFGGTAITRTMDLTWDTTNCRITQQLIEPGDPDLQVTRNIGYDVFGNVNSDAAIGINMAERKTKIDWSATDGQFPNKIERVLSPTVSESTQFEWDVPRALPTKVKDPNLAEDIRTYDTFGRPTREDRPDGTAITWDYTACTAPSYCGYTVLRYYVQTTLRDTSDAAVRTDHQYFDVLDRLKLDEPLLVTGARSQTAINYDAFGRVAQQSAPRFSSGTLFYTTFSYDLLDRVTQVSRPTSDSNPALQTALSYYEGLTTRTQNPLSEQTTKVFNAVGALARSTDPDGYYQSLDYDSFGNVLLVQDSQSNTLQSITYNKRGMRTAITDMDSGSATFPARTFTPNALGEITAQRDTKGQQRTFVYDTLGRLTSRTDTPEGVSTFTFGTSSANHNIGRLTQMSGPGYTENLTYDSVGRLSQRQIISDATYLINFAYNSIGALDTLMYPTSTSNYRLTLKYDYQNAELLRVKDFNASTTIFWEATNADPWGNIINETIGSGSNRVDSASDYDLATDVRNSIYSHLATGAGSVFQDLDYTFDAVGSLTQRQDALHALTEGFGYDNLHRLTSITGPDAKIVAYDLMGNITSKTGVGTYAYHATKKHQVTTAGTNTYVYDDNGNMTSRNGSAITWYSYDLPNTISAAGSNSSQFFYAPDRSRWKQVASYAGAGETTIYIGDLMEKTTIGSTTFWKHYIAGGTGVVAQYIRASTGTNVTNYLLKDHLSSNSVVLNATGSPSPLQLSFDAFGARRDGADWNGAPPPGDMTTISNTTRRGFTFHEHLDNLGLVHMNGRVYDPLLARFLSADPIVPAPQLTQSFNRYSYTLNNPLSYVDPSGYDERGHVAWIDGPDDPPPKEPGPNFDPHTFAGDGGLLAGGGHFATPSNERRWEWAPKGPYQGPAYRNTPIDDAQPRPGYTGSTVSGIFSAIGNFLGDFNGGLSTFTIRRGEFSACRNDGRGCLDFSDGFGQRDANGLSGAVNVLSFLTPLGAEFRATTAASAAEFRSLLAGSIRHVNPSRSIWNCVNCAIATDATLAGRPASALKSGPTSITVLEDLYGGHFNSVAGRSAIEVLLIESGPGARGIVAGSRAPGEYGHVFNGVNQNGTVRFLDGQIGGPATFDGFADFYFLRTN